MTTRWFDQKKFLPWSKIRKGAIFETAGFFFSTSALFENDSTMLMLDFEVVFFFHTITTHNVFALFPILTLYALKHSDASCHVNTLAATCVVSCAWLQNTNDKHFLSKYCTIILPNFAVVLFLSIFQSTVNK